MSVVCRSGDGQSDGGAQRHVNGPAGAKQHSDLSDSRDRARLMELFLLSPFAIITLREGECYAVVGNGDVR